MDTLKYPNGHACLLWSWLRILNICRTAFHTLFLVCRNFPHSSPSSPVGSNIDDDIINDTILGHITYENFHFLLRVYSATLVPQQHFSKAPLQQIKQKLLQNKGQAHCIVGSTANLAHSNTHCPNKDFESSLNGDIQIATDDC